LRNWEFKIGDETLLQLLTTYSTTMKNILFAILMLATITGYSQERYIGLTRDSITKFHAKNFEHVGANDTALLVKLKRGGLNWRFFKFDNSGICVLAAEEVSYYNDFTDLEKKLKLKKYKSAGEVEYNFVAAKVQGAAYTNGKDTYILMYKPINPNLSATTRAVVYYKNK
jgi:hypothetical protein